MPSKIHVGDTVDFEHTMRDDLDALVDISNPTTLILRLLKPNKTVLTRTALLVTDGLDSLVHYTCLVTDLDIQGAWARQFYVKLPSGEWTAKLFHFIVHRKIG